MVYRFTGERGWGISGTLSMLGFVYNTINRGLRVDKGHQQIYKSVHVQATGNEVELNGWH
jgi:hypothetical protein